MDENAAIGGPAANGSAQVAASTHERAGNAAEWGEIVFSMRRMDRTPLRRLVDKALRKVSPILRDSDVEDVSADPLRGWQRLAEAVTHGVPTSLDEYLRGQLPSRTIGDGATKPSTSADPGQSEAVLECDWPMRAACLVDGLLGHIPTDHPDGDVFALLVLGYCYFDCVVIWEHTADVEPLFELLDVVAQRCEQRAALVRDAAGGSGAGSRSEVERLLLLAAEAARGVQCEFDVENASMCSSPRQVVETSRLAKDQLAKAQLLVDASPVSDTASAVEAVVCSESLLTGAPLGMANLLTESVEDGLWYFGLLADEVGPAAVEFVDNLAWRRNDEQVLRRLVRARSAAVEAAAKIRGVFRTEARAQLRVVDAMLASLGSDDSPSEPTLVVDQGEVHFLFPFGLPSVGAGEGDLIQELLQRHAAGAADPQVRRRQRIVGRHVSIDEVLQTEVLSTAASLNDGDLSGRAGAKLIFPDDTLVLQTVSGERFIGLDVEVLLGALGNHLVRISMDTDTKVETRQQVASHGTGDVAWTSSDPGSSRWTPQDLDSLLHRGGLDFGDELIYFQAVDGAVEESSDPLSGPWSSVIELAAAIVLSLQQVVSAIGSDLHADGPGGLEDRGTGSDPGRSDPTDTTLVDQGDGPMDLVARAAHLRRQAHVLTVLTDVGSVSDGEWTPIQTPAELAACFGAAPLLSPQPATPRALVEWVGAAPLSAERRAGTDGLLGSLDGQIVCNGDSTLIFAPAAPNWQILEDRELIMFAVSLGSAYSLGRRRLINETEAAAKLDVTEELASRSRKELDQIADQVRLAEQRLTGWVKYADSLLEHALGAAVVRPRRDRSLLDHITERSGVLEQQKALLTSRSVAVDRLADIRDEANRVVDAERRHGQISVERFLLVVAVLGFIDLFWFFYDIENDGEKLLWTAYYLLMAVVLGVLGAVIFLKVFRSGSNRGTGSRRSQSNSGSTSR